MAFRYKKGKKYGGASLSKFDSKGFTSDKGTVRPLNGAFAVSGWFVNTLGQLIKVSGFQHGASPIVDKDGGAIWLKFKIFNTVTFLERKEYAYYNVKEGKAYLKKHNITISTKSKNGGYCGHLNSDALKQRAKNSKQFKTRR
ncbi:hypothetical protein [Tenacibaculum ovolyticum]|uniref:hypothetical protein n=1 Tax=Tenacibaculum ovolyticum TaxID=104270 RepID=UPI000400C0E9|nr:hypothetical protein [Tenacibaculum ovolyticum]